MESESFKAYMDGLRELVDEYGKAHVVKDLETYTKIEAMGDFESPFKNGSMWTWNGKLWYLSYLELSPKDLRELNEFYKVAENI